MKIVYEPGELERIEERHQEIISGGIWGGLFSDKNPEQEYGLTFTVRRPGLAEYLLVSLLNNALEDFDLGIDIKSIEFDVLNMSRSDLKNALIEAINKIV